MEERVNALEVALNNEKNEREFYLKKEHHRMDGG